MITTRKFISHIIKYLGAKAILDDVQELHRVALPATTLADKFV